MLRTFQVLLILLIFFSFFGHSQVQNDSITPLDEITLLEAFIKKKAIGITESTSLGTADLEQFSPIDFASGLNQISGLYVLSGALNTNRITIRGIGARTPFGTDKLRLYFNGVPVTNGTGVSTIEAYDFENMGRIEVVKGPKATSLGANLGGAVVLNTSSPEAGSTFLNNTFTFGSYNLVKDNLSFRHSDKNFNINFAYNHLKTDGYRQNNSFERNGYLLTSSIRLYEQGKLDLLLNHIDYRAEIPSSINATDFGEDPTRAASNWLAAQGFEDNQYTLVGLSFGHYFKKGARLTNSIFYTYLDHYEPRPFNILDEFTHGFGFRSTLEGTILNGDYTFGAELYRDEYNWQTFDNLYDENDGNVSLQGTQISDNKEFRSQWNLFGSYNFAFSKRLEAQIGLNLNSTQFDFRDFFNTGEANSSAQRDFDPIALPNLGVKYTFGNGHFFANISRGFSNPGLEETLTPDGVINPDIEQEKGTNYELGAVLSLLNNRLQLNTSIYQMNINDLLVAERIDEDLFIGRNVGETKHRGIELDANYSWAISKEWLLSPRISYSFSDHSFVDFVDGDDNFSGNLLPGVPKHRINSRISLKNNKGLVFYLNHQFVDKMPLNDANELYSDAFNVLNAQLRYRTQLWTNLGVEFNLGVNNFFDTTYAQSVLVNAVGFGGAEPRFFYPGNGRNYFAGIQLQYDIRNLN